MDKKIMDMRMAEALTPIVDAVLSDYEQGRAIDNTEDLYRLPDKEAIIEEIRKYVPKMKENGGYIFATSNVPFRGMPPERYRMILDIWKQNRDY